MKKVLLLSDIHANFPALKAVINSIKIDQFDLIINAGDLIVYGPFPNKSIKWCKNKKNVLSIKGNMEKRILRLLKNGVLKRPHSQEKKLMYYWTAEKLRKKYIEHLKKMPKTLSLNIENLSIGIFHGTAFKANETLFPVSSSKERFGKLAEKFPFKIHIMGHSHVPYHKIINDIHFINPGSVGRMFDDNPAASFAVLKISSKKISVKHFRVSYPVEKTINSLYENKFPSIFAKMFETGQKLN